MIFESDTDQGDLTVRAGLFFQQWHIIQGDFNDPRTLVEFLVLHYKKKIRLRPQKSGHFQFPLYAHKLCGKWHEVQL